MSMLTASDITVTPPTGDRSATAATELERRRGG
jgi:hypothetical protein